MLREVSSRSRYSEAPGGTHLKTHVKGTITVLPFFLPQKLFLRRTLDGIDKEDEAFLRRQGLGVRGPPG